MTENTTPETTDDLPYKDDTSDGTTAKTPQEIAEETADQVKSTDDLAREEAGIEHPTEGHDVREYEGLRGRHDGIAEADPQAPENIGDDSAVDEQGDDRPVE